MRTVPAIAVTTAFLTSVAITPTFAGQPDNPGADGQLIKEIKDELAPGENFGDFVQLLHDIDDVGP